MNVVHKILTALLVAACLCGMSAAVQASTLTFTGTSTTTGEITIPLSENTPIRIDEVTGNIHVRCVLDQASGVCQGLDVTPTGGAPGLTFSASLQTISAGQSSTLTWSTTTGAEVCVPGATPALTAWTGPADALSLKSPGGGTQAVQFSTAGVYTLRLTCYNDVGRSPVREVTVTVN